MGIFRDVISAFAGFFVQNKRLRPSDLDSATQNTWEYQRWTQKTKFVLPELRPNYVIFCFLRPRTSKLAIMAKILGPVGYLLYLVLARKFDEVSFGVELNYSTDFRSTWPSDVIPTAPDLLGVVSNKICWHCFIKFFFLCTNGLKQVQTAVKISSLI